MNKFLIFNVFVLLLTVATTSAAIEIGNVRIKDLSRVAGVRDNSLIGYGLVTGLSGTGDSTRNKFTVQSVNNLLDRFGIQVKDEDINSRNVAAVVITATLPAYASSGDKLDINVTSLGDAKSLFGGTLLLTNLNGPDGMIYALAQGAISVGGFKYDQSGNAIQKNHPTSGTIPNGATVEKFVNSNILGKDKDILLLLNDPDNTTADRIVSSINNKLGNNNAKALDAGRISIKVEDEYVNNLVGFLAKIETLEISPDYRSVVVVNERSGTVVSGGDIVISPVNITYGDMKVSIETENTVSQPILVRDVGENVRTQVVSNTDIAVTEGDLANVDFRNPTTVSDLVMALNKVKVSSRDVIAILLSIKKAGALHAELIVQ